MKRFAKLMDEWMDENIIKTPKMDGWMNEKMY